MALLKLLLLEEGLIMRVLENARMHISRLLIDQYLEHTNIVPPCQHELRFDSNTSKICQTFIFH